MSGTPDPEYSVLGDDLTVKFTARQGTISKDVIPPNRQTGGINGGIAVMLLELLKAKPNLTQKEIAQNLLVSTRTLQRTIKKLKDAGIIVRVGGNKSGHWEIKDK